MSLRGRSLDNPINWSFRIGRVWGIDIRLHLLFVLGAFWLLFQAMGDDSGGGRSALPFALMTVGILFGSVLLHEFGHCWGSRRSGGTADEILLWPLGGLAMVSPPHNPGAHALTVAAGPMVNVILCCVTAVTLTAAGGLGAVPWNPFDPFVPVGGRWLPGTGWWVARSVFTINYFLLLFNLLPTYPMDGGRLLQCWLWPRKGYTQATMTAAGVGMVGAIVFGILGLFTESTLLFMLAIFGYMTCYRERQAARMELVDNVGELGYDFSQGYTSLEREATRPKQPGYFERRRIRREQIRRQREVQRREELARRVDAILTKISTHGIQSLTSEERRILKQETERQRSSKT